MTQSPQEIAAPNAGTEHLTDSELRGLLAEERRRMTLDVLAGRDTPIDVQELAAGIAAREDGSGGTEEVAITLHHIHLPKLATHDVIEYDPELKLVSVCPGHLDH